MNLSESITRLSDREWLLKLRFGGGLHTRPETVTIDAGEAADGKNFDLQLDVDSFSNRLAFDLLATAPNAASVRGGGSLRRTDGSVTTLIQAGGNVYSFDGESTFTLVGTCHPSSRLRFGRESTSNVDDFAIITDLEKLTVVKTWDGTTYANLAHNLGGDFFAKYCLIDNERAFYFNVKSGAVDTPHLIVGSGRGTTSSTTAVANLTVTDRPSSALSAADPFYIPTPDLKPGNGIVKGFGNLVFSTERGNVWKLTGEDATDFAITDLFGVTGATGDEAIVNVGNDVLFGKDGVIESVSGVIQFGDVETDDISRWVSDQVEGVREWTMVYNRRLKKTYCWPQDGNELWALHNPRFTPPTTGRGSDLEIRGLSPWVKWTTDHGNGDFRQTAAFSLERPNDRLETVWFGGSAGQVFEVEGAGLQDGGDSNVTVERLSGLIQSPIGQSFRLRGRVRYKQSVAATLTLNFEYQGESVFDEAITITIPAISGGSFFGGDAWFGGDFYFGVDNEFSIKRQPWSVPGRDDFFQVRSTVAGAAFNVEELEIIFENTDP